MELNVYQTLAQRTANVNAAPSDKIENGILGMCGEAGECADILKKYLFQEHEFDRDKLMDEVGDVLWYIAETASGLGVTLEDIATRNIEKLKRRYPDGFDAEKSVHRPEYAQPEEDNTSESASVFLFTARNRTI